MSRMYSNTKKRSFKHFTVFQRGQIQALLEEGVPKARIARSVGISRSTLYNELKRGTVKQLKSDLTEYSRYFAETGQLVYQKHRQACRKPYKLDQASAFIQHLEHALLEDKLSPDAVCGRARREGNFTSVICTKTVYNYIDKGLLTVKSIDLPLRVRRNTHRHKCRKNRRILGASIEERPASVEERREFGHWEIDTVMGQRKGSGEVLLTMDERMTRKRHILRIGGKNQKSVHAALESLKILYGPLFPLVFRTVTSDNGSEFTSLGKALKGVSVYYAHPYASGERGTNEKQNSLVRRFIPKGTNIESVSDYTIMKAEQFINNLPRKMFDYRTPKELFEEQIAKLKTSS